MFAPVPPWHRGVPESLPDGAEDFWQLFEDPSSWADVATEIDAVKLHGWMFRFSFSDDQVRTVIEGLELNFVRVGGRVALRIGMYAVAPGFVETR